MKNRLNYAFKTVVVIAFFAILSHPSFGQDTPLGPLGNVTEFTVKPGHDMQFREGIKTWMACYLDNKGEWTWQMWKREQGEGNVYVLASTVANWAEMDVKDPIGSKCQMLATNLINPHVEKAVSHVTRFMTAASNSTPASGEIIRVTFYKLNGQTGFNFLPTINEISKIRKGAGSSIPGYWYSWLTSGPESPDYHLVTPYKNYAEMDITQEPVWTVVEKVAGKEKRDQLQAAFRVSIQDTWSYIYRLDKDLSRMEN